MNVFGDGPRNDGYQRQADGKDQQWRPSVAALAKRRIHGTGEFNR